MKILFKYDAATPYLSAQESSTFKPTKNLPQNLAEKSRTILFKTSLTQCLFLFINSSFCRVSCVNNAYANKGWVYKEILKKGRFRLFSHVFLSISMNNANQH